MLVRPHFSQTVDRFSSQNYVICNNRNMDNSVEIHQMSDSTDIIIAPEQPTSC